jgi:hypothetical protein
VLTVDKPEPVEEAVVLEEIPVLELDEEMETTAYW